MPLLDLFGDSYARNRQILLASVGIRTSADIFEAAQKEHEKARDNKQFANMWNRRQRSVPHREVNPTVEEDIAQEGDVSQLTSRRPQQKRKYVGRTDQDRPKHIRTEACWERSKNEQMEDVANVL